MEMRTKDALLWMANAVVFVAVVVSIPRVMRSGVESWVRIPALAGFCMGGAAALIYAIRYRGDIVNCGRRGDGQG